MDRELTKRALAMLVAREFENRIGWRWCPECRATATPAHSLSHTPDCPLAALIRDLEAAMKEAEDE